MTTITELIGELEALRAVYGDLPVLTRDCCGGLGPATLTVACRHRGMPYEAVNRVRNALTRRGLVEHTGVRGVYAVTDVGRARLALRRGTAGARPAAS